MRMKNEKRKVSRNLIIGTVTVVLAFLGIFSFAFPPNVVLYVQGAIILAIIGLTVIARQQNPESTTDIATHPPEDTPSHEGD